MIISSLHLYPIKSGRVVDVDQAVVGPRGFDGDRTWMVVDADGRFVSQREVAALARLSLTPDGLLRWDTDSQGKLEPTSLRRTVTVWSDTVDALDGGDDVANWLSERLDRAVRLVFMDAQALRSVGSDSVSFADGYPYLVATTASLQELNRRLERPLPMSRFRPNIVVSGDFEAFAEDDWSQIWIGDIPFDVVSPCARCVVTTVDQDRAIKDGPEPLATLSTFRRKDGAVNFGMNMIARGAGVVRVGDPIRLG